MVKRLVISLVSGTTITFTPGLVLRLADRLGWGEALWPIGFLNLRGTLIALIFSLGNVHTYNLGILFAANILFYGGSDLTFWSDVATRQPSQQISPSSLLDWFLAAKTKII